MYASKRFRVRDESEVFQEIEKVSKFVPGVERVFLADGNAMVMKTVSLLSVLGKLKQCFPALRRVSAYALPSDLARKSVEDIRSLVDAGLKMVYVGLETGDDELLKRVNKGETAASSLEGCLRAGTGGLKQSVMILNGLGGKAYSSQHARHSACLVNEIQPEYLSTLVLSHPFGLSHFTNRFQGEFEPLSTEELISEMGEFISELKLNQSVFRSDHASNYLVLKGQLNRDKEKLLHHIELALNEPDNIRLREEWQRGL
jgi:radical SAM superfamily enzyme YgiQ (UPF0313 family)